MGDSVDAAAAKWNKLITNSFPNISPPASIASCADLGCNPATTVKDWSNTSLLRGLIIYATIEKMDHRQKKSSALLDHAHSPLKPASALVMRKLLSCALGHAILAKCTKMVH
jgi:hypothetical protein